jgi:hypothetical protein
LVYVRNYNDGTGDWVDLNECIWRSSNLQSKHSLQPTLDEFADLFIRILDVPNATLDMLIAEIRDACASTGQDSHAYCKSLLLEISGKRETNDELEQLVSMTCWPCQRPWGEALFCGKGDFFINDRQLLYDMFNDSQTFLDLDFETTKALSELLRRLNFTTFLSEQVTIETEACQPLLIDHDLTQEYRIRGTAIRRYVQADILEDYPNLFTVPQIS